MIKQTLFKSASSAGYVTSKTSPSVAFFYLPQLPVPRPNRVEMKFTKTKPKKGFSVCFTKEKHLLLTDGSPALQPLLMHELVHAAFKDHGVNKTFMQLTSISDETN